MDRDRELSLLMRRVRAAAVRLRVNDALGAFARWLPLLLTYSAVALTLIKVLEPAPRIARGLIGVALLLAVLVAVLIARPLFRSRSRSEGALALDRHHGLADRVTSALEFSVVPPSERAPLMEAAISDGAAQAERLEPRRAVPLRLPVELLTSLALGALLALLIQVEVKRPAEVVAPAPSLAPLLVSSDDLDLLRDLSEELNQKAKDPELLAAARRFNQLVEDIGERRLDRHQVFSKLEEIERELSKLDLAKAEALLQGLEGLASELKKSNLSKPVAEALEAKNLADAEQALRELAQKLKSKRSVDRAELEKLRRALDAASKHGTERRSRLEAERREIEAAQERLLKKKAAGEKLNPREQTDLERQARRLERLERKRQNTEAAEQELSKIDRELAEAARKLMEEMAAGAEPLERSAADLNRIAREQMSEAEKQQLKERLEELRELLREQGKGGAERSERMQRFARRARGEPEGPASGDKSQGGPQRLIFDPSGGGVRLPIPAPATAARAGDPAGSGSGEPGGSQWGNDSDPSIKGDKTRLDGEMQDVSAPGIDTGQGPSVSSVVYGAAERGFAGGGYRKVYTDYKTVAEEAIERDRIPSGYEFYVRRYFQLIRPRD